MDDRSIANTMTHVHITDKEATLLSLAQYMESRRKKILDDSLCHWYDTTLGDASDMYPQSMPWYMTEKHGGGRESLTVI